MRRCLLSLLGRAECVVYVDSGSTDGSVAAARALGAVVHELDVATPFTAARARNAGATVLERTAGRLGLVQFVDGDCEVAPGWLGAATAFLAKHAEVVAVCGRRRERHPDRSVYNLLCDLEWNTPVGAAKACGGDVLVRAAAFRAVGGYRATLIAGEEPELCIRLRAAGGSIWRLDEEMTLHDAAMTRIGQWWKRSMRTGFAFAEGAHLHGAPPERHWVRESRSAWFWGLGLPSALMVGGFAHPAVLLGFALYPLQVARLYVRGGGESRGRLARAFFLVIGKFAEAAGQARYVAQRVFHSRSRLIEYK